GDHVDLTRRRILQAGGVLGVAALLTACGGGSPGVQPSTTTGGGTLRVGALGRTGAITRDPHGTQSNESDYLIVSLLYDTLTIPALKPNTAPRLAASWTH